MDLWELCEDELEIESLNQSLVKQKHGLENGFEVNRALVNSMEYHDKFHQLPLSNPVCESVYRQTGRLLDFANGQGNEYLVALNARTGSLVTDNFNRQGEIYRTGFIGPELSQIDECKDNIILIHNHSLNGRPSAQDMLSFLHQDKVQLSLVACHDGELYSIEYVDPEFETIYNNFMNYYKTQLNDIQEAKKISLTNIIIHNNKLKEKAKLFKVRRL